VASPTTSPAIPTIDISPFATGRVLPSPEAEATAAAIDVTLRQVGFLKVVGHGVTPDVKAHFFAAIREFFALPMADKQRLAIGNSRAHRGYVGFGSETLEGALADLEAGGHIDRTVAGAVLAGDLKETLDTGNEDPPDHPEVLAGTPTFGPNQLPDLPGWRDAYGAYRTAGIEAVLRMYRALSMALGLDPHWLESQPGETMYQLRMVHYPPIDRVAPEPSQLGCGAHTDYGSITVLADDGVGGLQVRQRSGEWVDVTIGDGELVVNLGDLMAIWTNDRWVSNPHRVVNPPDTDRYSAPLFVTPPYHLRIEPLPHCVAPGDTARYEPQVSGPYLLARFDGTHSYRNTLLDEHNRTAAGR
jgi:isopenicillin N synthase-like dioxygenase